MPINILEWGINLILSLQNMGDWLIAPMNFFTFLGNEDFYLLLIPVLYWCVDTHLGLQITIYLSTSVALNGILKTAIHGPRPYWWDARVRLLAGPETSFGIPSGHAQNAVVLWGGLAANLRKNWGWAVAIALMLLIGFSRMFLGVHFPTDVFVGWAIGIALLALIIRLESPVIAWLKKFGERQQIGILFAISLVMILIAALVISSVNASFTVPEEWVKNASAMAPDDPIAPLSVSGMITSMAAFFGIGAGAIWIGNRGGFNARGPIPQRVGRFLIGLVGVLVLRSGLDALFALIAPDETLLGYILRYTRYGLVGLWISALGPWVFIRLKLAEPEGEYSDLPPSAA